MTHTITLIECLTEALGSICNFTTISDRSITSKTVGTDAIAIAIINTLLTVARALLAGVVSSLEEVALEFHFLVAVALTALSIAILLNTALPTVRWAGWNAMYFVTVASANFRG